MTDDLTTTLADALAEHLWRGTSGHYLCKLGPHELAAVLVASSALKAHTDEAVEAAWDEGYEAFAQQFVAPIGADGTRAKTPNPYRTNEPECTCTQYVVDYSDPEPYHPENVDREDDPNCPVHAQSEPEESR